MFLSMLLFFAFVTNFYLVLMDLEMIFLRLPELRKADFDSYKSYQKGLGSLPE